MTVDRETLFREISKRTLRKPTQCSCKKCQSMCETPCLGTPQDIFAIIEAGYSDKVCYTEWAAGIILGFTNQIIPMVQVKEENGKCVFFQNGKCQIHDLGLKPTEGRLASHVANPLELYPKFNLTYNVAVEWSKRNMEVIEKIIKRLTEELDNK